MDITRFDHMTRLIGRATVRRRLLVGLAMTPLAGLVAAHNPDTVVARKRRKNKKKGKKPQPNEYGCLDVGKSCNGDSSQCCSGICEGSAPKKGKPDKSRCVGHDARICRVDFDLCTTGSAHLCKAGNSAAACTLTTGSAPFCGDFSGNVGDALCRNCSQDSDCQEEFGLEAACVVFAGLCESTCAATGGTACLPVCYDINE